MKSPEDLELENAGLRGQRTHLKSIIRDLKVNLSKSNDWNFTLQEENKQLKEKLASCSHHEQDLDASHGREIQINVAG